MVICYLRLCGLTLIHDAVDQSCTEGDFFSNVTHPKINVYIISKMHSYWSCLRDLLELKNLDGS